MSIKKFTEDVSHVSKLSDYPSEQELSAGALKSCFDRAAVQIQDYLNNSLTEEVEGQLAELRGQFACDSEVLTRKGGAITLRGKEMAVSNSFFGRSTEGEFGFFVPQALQGPQGEPGELGAAGPPGADGASVYAAASSGGFTGSQEELNTALAALPPALNRMVKEISSISIAAEAWQGDEAPFSYFHAMNGLTADSVITVSPQAERDNIISIGESMVLAQAVQGGLLFKAFEAKPARDISYTIVKEG